MYAIIRVAKVKSLGSLSGLSRHHTRASPTPNANTKAREAVRVLVGSGNPYNDAKALLPAKVRKNGVLAMEHLLTASPEYFRPSNPSDAGEYDQKLMEEWTLRAVEFLKDRYGSNLASAVLHLDESTPHIQALVIPKRADGKLDAATLFCPETLTDLQDRYAAAMEPLGLTRGLEGSKAKHEPIQAHYARVNRPTPPIPSIKTPRPSLPDRTIAEKVPFSDAKRLRDEAEAEAKAKQERRNAEIAIRRKAVDEALPVLIEKSKAFDERKKADESRQRVVDEMKKTANIVRALDLERVLEALGCERDLSDKKNWKTAVGRVTVTDQKFFNHDLDRGGGGAIDLVKQQLSCDYKSAVAWLASSFGVDNAVGAAMHEAKLIALSATQQKPPSPIPEPSVKPEHIERVCHYLVNTRKLSEIVVNACIKTGKIFAAVFSPKQGSVFVNAAFRLKDGVELRGTVGDYHGVRGKKGPFVLEGKTKEVAFVESSIDALSLKTSGFEGTVVSTTGNPSAAEISKIADEYRKMGFKIFAAFDNDSPGEAMSKLLYPSERMRPINKDWNEDLVRSSEPDDVSTAPRSRARARVR